MILNETDIDIYRGAALRTVLFSKHYSIMYPPNGDYSRDWALCTYLEIERNLFKSLEDIDELHEACSCLWTHYYAKYSLIRNIEANLSKDELIKWISGAISNKFTLDRLWKQERLLGNITKETLLAEFVYMLITVLAPAPYATQCDDSLYMFFNTLVKENYYRSNYNLEDGEELPTDTHWWFDTSNSGRPFNLTDKIAKSVKEDSVAAEPAEPAELAEPTETAEPAEPVTVTSANTRRKGKLAPSKSEQVDDKQLTFDDVAPSRFTAPKNRFVDGKKLLLDDAFEKQPYKGFSRKDISLLPYTDMNVLLLHFAGMSYSSIYWVTGISRADYDKLLQDYDVQSCDYVSINILVSCREGLVHHVKAKDAIERISKITGATHTASIAWFIKYYDAICDTIKQNKVA